MTVDAVRKILRDYADMHSQRAISHGTGVPEWTVSRFLSGKNTRLVDFQRLSEFAAVIQTETARVQRDLHCCKCAGEFHPR